MVEVLVLSQVIKGLQRLYDHLWNTSFRMAIFKKIYIYIIPALHQMSTFTSINNDSITEKSHSNQVFSDPSALIVDTLCEISGSARQTYLSQLNMAVCCILLGSPGSNWGHSGRLGQRCRWDKAPHAHDSHRCRSVNTEVRERESRVTRAISEDWMWTPLSCHIFVTLSEE